jgi:hypothetical protein
LKKISSGLTNRVPVMTRKEWYKIDRKDISATCPVFCKSQIKPVLICLPIFELNSNRPICLRELPLSLPWYPKPPPPFDRFKIERLYPLVPPSIQVSYTSTRKGNRTNPVPAFFLLLPSACGTPSFPFPLLTTSVIFGGPLLATFFSPVAFPFSPPLSNSSISPRGSVPLSPSLSIPARRIRGRIFSPGKGSRSISSSSMSSSSSSSSEE